MAVPVHVPRINNNDDEVRLVAVGVAVGDAIEAGQSVAEIETDKAVVEVEAAAGGFVLRIDGEVDRNLAVGSVLMWVGEAADEPLPESAAKRGSDADGDTGGSAGRPTAKARILLKEHGLDATQVPYEGSRLTVGDIERYLAGGAGQPPVAGAPSVAGPGLDVPASSRALRQSERAMVATVSWQRDVAVPGYVETEYDASAWEQYSDRLMKANELMLSPLLALMSWRLVGLAVETPLLNSTVAGDRMYQYSSVNLGFTVQAGETLYLAVVRDAQSMDELDFVHALGDLQRRAAAHKLGADETSGCTIGFSSMARWKVSRHMPVLPPHTSLMIAHTVSASGQAVLGASYDHRVLDGSHVVTVLRRLSKPSPDNA